MSHKAYTESIKPFPFAYNTPNILTGAPLYVPVVGELLMDAWLEVDAAWDGTTPLGDFGTFSATNYGILGNALIGPLSMTRVDALIEGPDFLGGKNASLAQQLTAFAMPPLWQTGAGLNPASILVVATTGNITWRLPFKMVTANPIKICVSQDGTNTGADPGSTQGAGVLYLVTATPA